MDGETEDDGPVGIVVTDWFNLSLYRMAEWKQVNEGKHDLGGRTRLAGSIEAKHEQPHFLVTKEAA